MFVTHLAGRDHADEAVQALQHTAGFLRSALAQAREGGARLAGHAANYLAAENAILARGSEVERFAREVHALRDAVERLDKRLAALQGRRPA